jgi:hypothetical protein
LTVAHDPCVSEAPIVEPAAAAAVSQKFDLIVDQAVAVTAALFFIPR